jgi:hypothetical protein
MYKNHLTFCKKYINIEVQFYIIYNKNMAEKRNNPSPNGPITFENRIRELEREASQTRGKIKDLKSAQEKIRNMQIYSKTEEGQDEILR